jgi:hypothetical protein
VDVGITGVKTITRPECLRMLPKAYGYMLSIVFLKYILFIIILYLPIVASLLRNIVVIGTNTFSPHITIKGVAKKCFYNVNRNVHLEFENLNIRPSHHILLYIPKYQLKMLTLIK